MLFLPTPFLSSTGFSFEMKKFFIVVTLTSLSSFLYLILRGKVFILLMVLGIREMENPLTTAVALSSP